MSSVESFLSISRRGIGILTPSKQSYSPYEGGKEAAELNYPSGFSRNVPEVSSSSYSSLAL